jgi:hypothetical protein
MGCGDGRLSKCVAGLVLSMVLNAVLVYALIIVLNMQLHPVVVMLGVLGFAAWVIKAVVDEVMEE